MYDTKQMEDDSTAIESIPSSICKGTKDTAQHHDHG